VCAIYLIDWTVRRWCTWKCSLSPILRLIHSTCHGIHNASVRSSSWGCAVSTRRTSSTATTTVLSSTSTISTTGSISSGWRCPWSWLSRKELIIHMFVVLGFGLAKCHVLVIYVIRDFIQMSGSLSVVCIVILCICPRLLLYLKQASSAGNGYNYPPPPYGSHNQGYPSSVGAYQSPSHGAYPHQYQQVCRYIYKSLEHLYFLACVL
jgi:hypothetical protein